MVKNMATKQKRSNSEDGTPKTGKRPRRSFPIVTLEDALKIPLAIKTKNSGNPLESKLVAKACGIAHMTNKFFYHSSAARDYGLTVGTRDSPTIELTELGRAVVYADNADKQRQKEIEAFFKVEKFKQVYDHYNGSDLPEEQYVSNTLENKFQIPSAQHAEFVEVFVDAPLAVCEKRDPKNLYKKARAGEIREFTGIDAPYETPVDPEIVVQTHQQSVEESTATILERLLPRLK